MRHRWLLLSLLTVMCQSASAVQIQAICRLKGQEPVRLTGLGLVVGLPGTGDARFTPLHNNVANALKLLGSPVRELKDVAAVKNVALVAVTCEIPGVGGREGDVFDCHVSSIGTAKSLAGGRLLRSALLGPISTEEKVFALAEGPMSGDGPGPCTSCRIKTGAKLIEELPAPYIREPGILTLIINEAHSSFVTAHRIAERINTQFEPVVGHSIALPLDARNIEVTLPSFDGFSLSNFLAQLMEIDLASSIVHTQARVIINEKTSTIVVTGEVELTPVLVTHRNLTLFPNIAPIAQNQLVPLTNAGPPDAPINPLPAQLNDLIGALNRAQVSSDDKIAIIKELAKTGKLHAQIVYE